MKKMNKIKEKTIEKHKKKVFFNNLTNYLKVIRYSTIELWRYYYGRKRS